VRERNRTEIESTREGGPVMTSPEAYLGKREREQKNYKGRRSMPTHLQANVYHIRAKSVNFLQNDGLHDTLKGAHFPIRKLSLRFGQKRDLAKGFKVTSKGTLSGNGLRVRTWRGKKNASETKGGRNITRG